MVSRACALRCLALEPNDTLAQAVYEWACIREAKWDALVDWYRGRIKGSAEGQTHLVSGRWVSFVSIRRAIADDAARYLQLAAQADPTSRLAKLSLSIEDESSALHATEEQPGGYRFGRR